MSSGVGGNNGGIRELGCKAAGKSCVKGCRGFVSGVSAKRKCEGGLSSPGTGGGCNCSVVKPWLSM